MNTFLKLSEQLLNNVKLNKPFDDEVSLLSTLSFTDLLLELNTDTKKKTFWVNIYNSFYQILAVEIQDKSIYKKRKITVANRLFSLDSIEHGILRKGKMVLGFGYLFNPFYPSFIKKLQVDKLDYRIHFALNCGAVSCPPILFYKSDTIDQQLQLASFSFIELETTIDNENKIIATSRLFLWYKADFGSKTKMKQIIGTIFNQNLSNYKLKYTTYNWTKQLHNFK